VFDWRDDPRKNDAWYAKQKAELDPVIVAQEIDRDYNASIEDSFIPAMWVAAAIDAHIKLGIEPVGIRVTGFDPADVGDAKACVTRWGSVVVAADSLKAGDITQALPWAFEHADNRRVDVLAYDADGMGAPAMKLALTHRAFGRMKVEAYRGSAGIANPFEIYAGTDKTNESTFANFRAQSWTWLRDRFHATYNAVQRADAGHLVQVDPEKLISISSQCAERMELQAELSAPKRIFSPNGKIQVESKAAMRRRGVSSPNLADALVIAMSQFAPKAPKAARQQQAATSYAILG
jgi:phage terminase large subunit